MRIIVVEDEDRIRKGISRLIHKLSDVYQVVGECENGLEGIASIKQMKPDLVITDIRMPLMGGIEMLEALKEEGITPRTVILSGYSEFEFARKALQIGFVIEYLLKPITADDLKQVLLNAEKDMTNDLQNGIPATESSMDREQVVKLMLTQADVDVERIPEHVKQWIGEDDSSTRYIASVYIGKSSEELLLEVKSTLHHILGQDSRINDFTLVEIPELFEINILLHMKSSKPNMSSLWEHLITKLYSLQLDDFVITWTILPHIKNLKIEMLNVRSMRKWALIIGTRKALDKHMISNVTRGAFHYSTEWEQRIKEAVSSHDQARLRSEAELFVEYCIREAAEPQHVIDACIQFAAAILYVAGVILGEVKIAKEQKDIYNRLSLVQTPYELKEVFRDTTDKIAEGFITLPKSHSLVINKAVKMIQDKYQSGITLEELANLFCITPEYLSSLFQKELGISFTSFIKELRIRKAKELLILNKLKAFEIAEQVGYSDAKYFSRVFKEATGHTPGEFQRLYR
ncbi:response regulator [Paenibacillus sp. LMG 31456]|uniref:Response regulator n=1 Tax=Paenibacillus foliorum TaxID=2654974 RepID=A0A972K1Z1_9BACL|nr:response regulator [Paenibacillus foliorum]NOU94388.1 response regulator [Paenibacillus foliorum]